MQPEILNRLQIWELPLTPVEGRVLYHQFLLVQQIQVSLVQHYLLPVGNQYGGHGKNKPQHQHQRQLLIFY